MSILVYRDASYGDVYRDDHINLAKNKEGKGIWHSFSYYSWDGSLPVLLDIVNKHAQEPSGYSTRDPLEITSVKQWVVPCPSYMDSEGLQLNS